MFSPSNLIDPARRVVAEIVEREQSAAKVSDRTLAPQAGMSRSTLERRKATGDFTFGELAAIARVLDADLAAWFRELADRIGDDAELAGAA